MRSPTLKERFLRKFERGEGCWNWKGARRNGYGIINRGDKVPEYAHRLAYEFAHGPIADRMVVRHSCDNPACVNPAHLALGTKQDNARDMVRRGRLRGGPNFHHGRGEFAAVYSNRRDAA